MQYIVIDKEKFVEVDLEKNTAKVFIKGELEKQLKEAQERLAKIPEKPGDEELLEWARVNYPIMNYSREKEYLETQISEAQQLLEIK